MKTRKSLFKRVKITARKKILKRPPGQNHFNAKDGGNAGRIKKGFKTGPRELIRNAKALLQNM